MNQHRVKSNEVPRRLYFVFHDDLQVKIYPGYEIKAKDSHSYFPYPNTEEDFARSLEDHLDWESKVPIPYISVISGLTHAENWALDCAARKGSKTYLYEIRSKS